MCYASGTKLYLVNLSCVTCLVQPDQTFSLSMALFLKQGLGKGCRSYRLRGQDTEDFNGSKVQGKRTKGFTILRGFKESG